MSYSFFKKTSLLLSLLIGASVLVSAQNKTRKILVIGVDGIINTAIDYASTPGIDQLLANGSYSMNGYSGVPVYSNSGWATMLTGVTSDKHGANSNESFEGNNFDAYPSVVGRIKTAMPALKVASVVRNKAINDLLNSAADEKFQYGSDAEVFSKASELLKQPDIGATFLQFSKPAEIGNTVGYQLREAQYVLAIQEIDQYVGQLLAAVNTRATYADENWAVFLVSSHGGTESGVVTNNSVEEINVPVIFSGGDMDKKELVSSAIAAREGSDNILTIDKAASQEKTFVRVPINGTSLQGMERFTIEMWVKAGANSSDPSIMGDKDWGSGGNPGFTICRSGSGWKINIASDKRERYDIGSTKSIEDGNWHHLAVTFDKTNECIVYQDGEKMSESKLIYKAGDKMASPFNYLNLGQDGTGSYGGGAPNWAGSFNEVRIWTDVLSAQTIRDYMYLRNVETSQHPHLSSLNLYLKFDEVRGSSVRDYSGKGNHGELVGPATERHPHYPIGLTDVSVNILSHFGINVDAAWGLQGASLKSNVPFRLFKVN